MDNKNLFILILATVGFFIAYFILHVKFIGDEYIWLIVIQSVIASLAFFALAIIHATFNDIDQLAENLEIQLPEVAGSKTIIGFAGALMILLLLVIIAGSMFFEHRRVVDIVYISSFLIVVAMSLFIIMFTVYGSSDLSRYTNHINSELSTRSSLSSAAAATTTP
jgi:uncharacterized protein YacL